MRKILTFEERYEEICEQIEKRRHKWRLSSVSFDDMKQIILLKIFLNYHTYDTERGQFSHWVNRVITNSIKNGFRDNYLVYSRPCITGCVYNTGGDSCSRTTSGIQCKECPIYADWEKRKLNHFNIAQTLPMENHVQEVSSIQSDFMDIDGGVELIHLKMKEKLTKHEFRMYKLLYIQHKSEREVGTLLGYKNKKGGRLYPGYLAILHAKTLFKTKVREIIDENDLG